MSERIEEFWCSSYRKKFRASYRFTKRDGVLLRNLLKDFRSESFLRWAICRFFDHADDVYARTMGHTVPVLHGRIQAYWNEWSKAHARDLKEQLAEQLDLVPEKVVKLADKIGRRM